MQASSASDISRLWFCGQERKVFEASGIIERNVCGVESGKWDGAIDIDSLAPILGLPKSCRAAFCCKAQPPYLG